MRVLVNENEKVSNDFIKFIKDSASLFKIHLEIFNDDEIIVHKNNSTNKVLMNNNEPIFNILYDDEDANYGQI